MADSKAAPLTEDQRTEVRQLLQRLSQQSTARATRRGTTRPNLVKTKKLKRMVNPFDGIEANKVVQGVVLAPDVVTLPLIQRTRIILLPYHLDQIPLTRKEWIKVLKYGAGLDLSQSDGGTNTYLKFIIEANPPVKYLHLYLEKAAGSDSKYLINNWLYAT
tara:strand:- start:155 stop:637 length:483 start_codon:yes stop_codon:yes gene_type:complete